MSHSPNTGCVDSLETEAGTDDGGSETTETTELYIQHAEGDALPDGMPIRHTGPGWVADTVNGDSAIAVVLTAWTPSPSGTLIHGSPHLADDGGDEAGLLRWGAVGGRA